jgi:hypothetical protein
VDILLDLTFEQLGFDAQFCLRAHSMGFFRLEEVLLIGPAELTSKPDFSYRWLAELGDLLRERGMLHLLQTIPGRSSG